ncbi:Zinc finger Ran-binding domain-containing protein 2 [Desmophyllum pertusum]|uniref:Zinc finger Ran-binding domain-containing protein 2 n=1 Tax=Desmophyllum pertusum TaxID=174260 RepID=A0A9W9ZSB8_9CNID|nr:Zinc finger Ran-binding domain-containing protein 2 [Desmophyllum pertusum]
MTRYGGGYNERDGVEYVEREASDDEFDEFGRRRKPKQGSNPTVAEQKAPNKEPDNDKEDDDDDDDDDEEGGDLSKYNLDDEDEDDDEDGDLSKYNLDDSDSENKDKGPVNSSPLSAPPILLNSAAQDQNPVLHPPRKNDAVAVVVHLLRHRQGREAALHAPIQEVPLPFQISLPLKSNLDR